MLFICLGLMSFSVAGDTQFSQLDDYLQTLHDNNKLMFSVTVNQKGKVIYDKHLGIASQIPKREINKDTQFRIGSVTKTFTAAIIMQLVEAKKLSLDTPLSTFYKQIKHADKITVAHLLSHRSGIANFTDDASFSRYMYFPQSTEQMLKIIEGMESLFVPGSKHQYSNSNYVLLGFIIERLTQRSYAKVLEQQITKPLLMNRTEYGQAINIDNNQARSFHYSGFWSTLPESNMTVPHGAGAIISTSKELTHFFEALFKGKLLSLSYVKQMTALNDNYGYGLYSFPYHDKQFIGHNGRIDGFISVAAYQPEDEIAIALLANGVNYAFNDVVIAILDSVYNKGLVLPNFNRQSKTYSEKELQKLVGHYVSNTLPLDIKVYIENGQLYAQATNQRALPLDGYEDLVFKFDLAGITIKFEHLDDNSVKFLLIQGGGQHLFVRD